MCVCAGRTQRDDDDDARFAFLTSVFFPARLFSRRAASACLAVRACVCAHSQSPAGALAGGNSTRAAAAPAHTPLWLAACSPRARFCFSWCVCAQQRHRSLLWASTPRVRRDTPHTCTTHTRAHTYTAHLHACAAHHLPPNLFGGKSEETDTDQTRSLSNDDVVCNAFVSSFSRPKKKAEKSKVCLCLKRRRHCRRRRPSTRARARRR